MFDVYASRDEASFSGADTGDGCLQFDTNAAAGGNPGAMMAGPLRYSCGNTAPDTGASPVPINPTGSTVSLASGQSDSIAEAIPANGALTPICCIDNWTIQAFGIFDNVDPVSGLLLDASDDYTCAFTNTKNFVGLVLARSVSNTAPDVGGTLTHTLQLTNNGPVPAQHPR